MWINYSDSEVRVFHPVCEKALNKALKALGIEDEYKVEHHELFGSIEADFVIKNRITNKYLCIIEVKRTKSDIQSTRYQYQSMSYVQEARSRMEKPYYIITNLEYSYTFRYDPSKPNSMRQMLEPGLVTCGSFSEYENEEVFVEKLSEIYQDILKQFIDDNYTYIISLDRAIECIEGSKENIIAWRTNIAVLLYEYIRGCFEAVGRSDFKNINLFMNDVFSICEEATFIDFNPIFNYSEKELESKYKIENDILEKIYSFGKEHISGEIIANLIHQIISAGKEEIGEVPTDIELSYLVSLLAKIYHGKAEIRKVCDPAAGSGSLIGSAINVFNLNPTQLKANDINEQLLQVLSVRLGLKYIDVINVTNTVEVTAQDASALGKDYFNEVDIVLMNPPYLSGTRQNCREKKDRFALKISELNGATSTTNCGQIGLECVFTELISNSISENATFACILPKQYLFALGNESAMFRSYLINHFGLSAIFIYSGQSVFGNVIKDTVVLIGKRNLNTEVISVIHSMIPIQDLDSSFFENIVKNNFESVINNKYQENMSINNVSIQNTSKKEFIDQLDDGWGFIQLEADARQKLIEILMNTNKIASFGASRYFEKVFRGKAGNSGGSDLIFSKEKDSKSIMAVRNAKLKGSIIVEGDSVFNIDQENIEKYVDNYIENSTKQSPGQEKKEKSKEELITIYNNEFDSIVNGNCILMPRNLRKSGSIYCVKDKCLVSTNFYVIENLSKKELIALTSWMKTIFYQATCEIYAKPQEGTRKLEKEEISRTLIPKNLNVTDDEVILLEDLLIKEPFVELDKPVISEIDKFWANRIFGEESEKSLNFAKRVLKLLASIRQKRI